jgi:uncharacterized cofD-like protein
VTGEHLIDEPAHDGKMAIVDMWTTPKATISPKAKEALKSADFIIIGPGDFFTNTVPNLVVSGVCEAIMSSSAKLIFVENLMTKYGDSIGFTAKTFIEKLSTYLPSERIDYILVNNDFGFPEDSLLNYKNEGAEPVQDDLDSLQLKNTRIVRAPILSHGKAETQKGDVLVRSVFRHDQEKLGEVLQKILLK